MNWAYVTGRVGGVKVEAGRQDFTKADVVDMRGDGIKLAYGNDVKVFGWAAKAASDSYYNVDSSFVEDGDRFYVAGVETKIGVVGADVRYYNADSVREQEIWELAVNGDIAKDLNLRASYFNGDTDAVSGLDDNGWLVGLSYKGAKASKVGSWGVYANYSERPVSTYFIPTSLSGYASAPYADIVEAVAGDGYEGYEIGANVTLAKNIVAGVKYYDLEQRDGDKDAQTLWSEVVFTF